jgi:crotonobetainyl-CoA:carnitine CoA-transferase CaiB-like acyl-CoA transferase
MTAPLQDIRVVEIASYVAIPAAGALLADMGAEVIKVEVPGGETLRHALPKRLGYRHGLSEAPHFHMENRGKRSISLNLTKAAAREALARVIEGADIVLTNLLPKRLEKFGLDAATLRADRPELIFASLNGYGTSGPEANTPAFDYTAYWARTGLMDGLRDVGAPPAFLRPGVGDHASALAITSGILAALRVRDRDGVGQEIDVNLMHMGFYINGNDACAVASTGIETPRHDTSQPRNPIWSHYKTSDDRYAFLVMIDSQNYWPEFCRAIGMPELADDERFHNEVGRYRNSKELSALIAGVIGERSLAEWEVNFADFTLIWAPARTLGEALADPQVAAMRMISEVEHAETIRTVAPPIHMSLHAMDGKRPAPSLGADSEAILREAGCSDEQIQAALKTD